MYSMCTNNNVPCVFNGETITCKDIISNKIMNYNLDEQNEIQYLDTYKKNNKLIKIICVFLYLTFLSLFIHFLAYVQYK